MQTNRHPEKSAKGLKALNNVLTKKFSVYSFSQLYYYLHKKKKRYSDVSSCKLESKAPAGQSLSCSLYFIKCTVKPVPSESPSVEHHLS